MGNAYFVFGNFTGLVTGINKNVLPVFTFGESVLRRTESILTAQHTKTLCSVCMFAAGVVGEHMPKTSPKVFCFITMCFNADLNLCSSVKYTQHFQSLEGCLVVIAAASLCLC